MSTTINGKTLWDKFILGTHLINLKTVSINMGENPEDYGDCNMDNSELAFDNLTILKEISNIANLVRVEDFLETVPKAKLRRVKWVPMFNCLKQDILDEMVQELSAMWKYENMPEKLEILQKQKEKFFNTDNQIQWRPQLGDVKSQLRAHDAANLKKQKKLLETLATEYDTRVKNLKKTISAKRGYIKALQMDVLKYQKKNEEYVIEINENIENHSKLIKALLPSDINLDKIIWTDQDLNPEEGKDKTDISV